MRQLRFLCLFALGLSLTLTLSFLFWSGPLPSLQAQPQPEPTTPASPESTPEAEGLRINRGRRSSTPLPNFQGSINFYEPPSSSSESLGKARIPFLFPLAISAPVHAGFGWQTNPFTQNQEFNTGVDISAPVGTPVIAVYAGEVAIADYVDNYGLTVVVRHEKGSQESYYGHLSQVLVQPGELIEQGKVVGFVGGTGNAPIPQLHFEWRQLTPGGWVAVDPGPSLELARENLFN